MLQAKPNLVKVVSAMAMVIALLSAGILIVHQSQGHATTTSVSHINEHPAVPANGVLTDAWFNEICAGIIFLTLLTGTRFWLARNSQSKLKLTSEFRQRNSIHAPTLNRNLCLTRPQLGVFRI